jgi:O-antigen/teichoic acid export membrane protein
LLALLTVPTAVLIIHLTMVTLLLGRVDITNRGLTIAAGVQFAAVLALAWSRHLTASTVVWVWAICGVLPLFIMWPTIRPHVGKRDVALAWRMVGVGAQYHVGLIALYLLLRIDVLILNALAPMAAVGLYTLSVSIGEMAYGGTDSIAQALLRRQAESKMAAAGDLTVRTVRVAAVVAIVSIGGICATAPFLVPAIYGRAFQGSVAPLFALGPGLIVYTATRPLSPYLLRLERPRLLSALSVTSLLVNVSLNLILIPRYGIVGCAWASTIGYSFFGIGQAIWFSRAAGTRLAALLPRWSDVSLIASAALEPLRRRISPAADLDR